MKKIMMVDDEADQIFAAKIALEHDGEYEVIGANNGKHCFELLEDGQIPDLILLDLMMPEMSGWTVHDRLKKKDSPYNDIPIIFLTGATDDDSEEVGGWFGEDYIEKPYDVEDLKKRIDKVLKKF
ncbi:MAG: response regulator [Candidatus Thermoplasmatota archaeon]|nr:response regulator [Candidatus Thermoplasmatota archaeon]